MRYRIKNWERYQHYSGRNPPWVKLHTSLLEDAEFEALPDETRLLLVLLFLLAARTHNAIPADPGWVARRVGMSAESVSNGLGLLANGGWLIPEQGEAREAPAARRPRPKADHPAPKIPTAHQEAVTLLCEAWRERFGAKPQPQAWVQAIKGLLEHYTPAELDTRFRVYLAKAEAKYVSFARFAQTVGDWDPAKHTAPSKLGLDPALVLHPLGPPVDGGKS